MKVKSFLSILIVSFIFIGCTNKQSKVTPREQSDKIAEDLKYDAVNSIVDSIF